MQVTGAEGREEEPSSWEQAGGPTARCSRRRLAVLWGPLGVSVALICGVCLLFNAPAGPLRAALIRPADAAFGSWYRQSWNLFAPGVPTATVRTTLSVRFADRGGGPQTASWDLSRRFDSPWYVRLLKQDKEEGLLFCFAEYARGIRPGKPPGLDASARMQRTHCRDDYVAPAHRNAEEPLWDRFFSAHGRELAGPGRPIAAVRVRFTARNVPPYRERHRAGGRSAEVGQVVYDSGWRPYVAVEGQS
ncbi:DUF5819 family protein [Streptomyces albus]|uniref:DUF5819 family protein n=1 Tax=Streptomyces sp. PHES57 TaxID=2872626 RepID=UPI001CEC2335|nr:DUF5819 family protein [Streptomyces sp. PHES57]